MMVNDNIMEWNETLELLKEEDEVVLSELSFGKYVTVKKELFDNIINEINAARMKEGNMELIVLTGEEDGE